MHCRDKHKQATHKYQGSVVICRMRSSESAIFWYKVSLSSIRRSSLWLIVSNNSQNR